MKTTALLAAAAAAATLVLAAGPADAHLIGCYRDGQPAKSERRCALRNYHHASGALRWLDTYYKRELAQGLSPFTTVWRNHAWLRRDARLRLDRLDRTLPMTGDWLTAVQVAQRPYPGSGWWLVSCSRTEGGHGPWVWYGHLSYPRYGTQRTPGGPMQYMQGTFWTDFNRAFADLRARGWTVPFAARSYYSMLGQALAGGWAYYHDRPAGKWTGSGC